ncbi:hypothetical protein LGV61_04645 [Desulfurispirillum indicum]|uniref:Uncharacterized protein n=1 Tax=Desulfurispirillum indicum (strain ATCC BAA-1389 / DSM 22839 / S5) TaxID=653733 RepID=E6W2L0_DESIS|nr:hypothetical protein [Desulfurispirillum indicum]ADU65594.1 hypothetical protein Selin_0854 [Desulfurispirillum indicum S5]UCZ57574.1 hypothetical protein LGV61_04645 [Desulfurispirillum indicum]
MQNIDVIKRYSDELAKILTLSELISSYLSAVKPKTARGAKKQNDKGLTGLLRKEYALSDQEVQSILDAVAGKKKSGTKTTKSLSSIDVAQLKKDIDAAVAAMGITVRDQGSLSYEQYLRKIKSNLSVRKVKALQVLDLNQGRRTKRSSTRKK